MSTRRKGGGLPRAGQVEPYVPPSRCRCFSKSISCATCTHGIEEIAVGPSPCTAWGEALRDASRLVAQRWHRARRGHRATCSSRSLLSMIQRRMSRLRIIVSKTSWHLCTERRPLGSNASSQHDQCHFPHLRCWAYSSHSKRRHRQNLAGEDAASDRHEAPLQLNVREDSFLKYLKKHGALSSTYIP